MMKTLSVFLVVAIAACGGKKEGGGEGTSECAAAAANAYKVSASEFKQAGIDEATGAKMQAITSKRCTADSWDPTVVACFKGATSQEAMTKCADGLAAKQKTTWASELATVAPKAAEPPAGSGGSADGSAGSGSATGGGSAAGSGSGSAKGALNETNDSCKALGATLAKAAACDKLPKQARDAYAQVASITDAAQCKATETSIRTSAAATCGW